MSKTLEQFDNYLATDGPAALVIREELMPVEGVDGVVFPATFAAAEDKKLFAGGYNIDYFGPDKQGPNICLIDSVGSQANRIEPIFDERECDGRYGSLVPQVRIRAGDHEISIFEAGHRAGDALVRCSELQEDLANAFAAVQKSDCQPLAKLAPTSLVFGVWDSRGTQAKLPRLITSTIRAFDVRPLHRSAQYIPPIEYVEKELLPKPATKDEKAYSERGFNHNPATWSHGGVIADAGIRRDATLSLAALRLTCTTPDADQKRALQRYILGLALTAFTFSPVGYLRQGCNLVRNPERPLEFVAVHNTGERHAVNISHEDAIAYAKSASEAFSIGENRTVPFDKKRATAEAKSKKS